MAKVSVTIQTDNTGIIKEAVAAAVVRALEEVGMQAERNAKKEVTRAVYDTPAGSYVRTGNLRNYISHTHNGKDTAFLTDNINYAAYVEYGTSRMPARPFFKPAIQNYTDEYIEIIKDNLKNA